MTLNGPRGQKLSLPFPATSGAGEAVRHSEVCGTQCRLQWTIVFQKKILGLADSELAQVAISVEETPKYLS